MVARYQDPPVCGEYYVMPLEEMQIMKLQIVAKVLGALMLLHALGNIDYVHSAATSLAVGSPTYLGIGLLNLATWLLLVASGVGLLVNKRWVLLCIILFALLSPISMMLFFPFIGSLVPPGLPLIIALILVNLSVVAFTFHIRRCDGKLNVA